ncbi:MAG: ATP-dependent DNA helicase RecG [Candidatus Magasanikbacteria bacterium]
MNLEDSVREIKGVGEKTEEKLNRLDIETVKDLLHHFPYRYEDYTQVKPISELAPEERVTIEGEVEIIKNKRSKKKNMMITEAVVADSTDQLRVVWFSQPYVKKKLDTGDKIYLSGKIRKDNFGLEMINPKFEQAKGEREYTNKIIPVYHLTEGLSENKLSKILNRALEVSGQIEDWIPKKILEKAGLVQLSKAIELAHNPKQTEDIKKSQKRLKFNELFLLHLKGEVKRRAIETEKAPVVNFQKRETKDFVNSLNFDLTNDQRRAAWEIIQDLEQDHPMNRLLEGDVGSGKTVVATIAFKNVVANGYQSAFMAPTEILSKQHFNSLQQYFDDDNTTIALYTGSDNELYNLDLEDQVESKKREEVRKKIKMGNVDIVVGTHALITSKVEFNDLALAVVDEQHRFGVKQRKKLREKSGNKDTSVHFLSTTATPIPRSFALTLHGDLDLSIIKQLPPGRKPVKTRLVEEKNRPKTYEFVKKNIKQGNQAFVVCPLIESSEKMPDKKSVEEYTEYLDQEIFQQFEVGKIHGKMNSEKKNKVMSSFERGDIDILVSTSVVEVGVDIPNANMMLIEDAERFGLAQLHQLRGRVGRSDTQAYCFLFSSSSREESHKRLTFFQEHTDGFKVAEYDLKDRGPGEVFGERQSGVPKFEMASIEDRDLIKLSKKIAQEIDFEKYPKIKEKVEEFEQEVHLE